MNRLVGPNMASEAAAEEFDPTATSTEAIVEALCERAALLVGTANAELVRGRLISYMNDWTRLAGDSLRYSWLNGMKRPPGNSRVLLRTAGTDNEGEWITPGSLREVEPTAAFYLAGGDD